MYHSISDDPESDKHSYFKVCTAPRRFAEQLEWLAASGYRGVTLTEGLAWLNENSERREATSDKPTALSVEPKAKNEPLIAGDLKPNAYNLPPRARASEKLVAITFDDGFKDFYTEAFPLLKRHGFSATMYLPTAFIGDDRRKFKDRECLTWQEVRELSAAGMEFGSHTVNHPRLVQLPWPDIEAELRDSRTEIEQQLGLATPAFAYPYGFPQAEKQFVQRFHSLLRQTGYTSCATTVIGRAWPRSDRLSISRLPANSDDDREFFVAKLRGAYDWLAAPQALTKQFARWFRPAARPVVTQSS
jgi:peptidoglycan/xylan/chitin deacetylase (PgdA/CDA1 family)